MKLSVKLPPPIHKLQEQMLNFILDPDPTCRECFVAVGTKGGKSMVAAIGGAALLYTSEQAHLRWIAPRYNQSKIGMNYVRKFIPYDHPNKKVRNMFRVVESDPPTIISKANDTILEFLHAMNPGAIEGFATNLNFLDEIAKYKRLEEVINSVRTTTTMTRGKIMGFSTPLSKGNYFYHLWREAKDEMEWCIRNKKKPTKIALTAPTTSNPLISPVVIAEMRRNMPERLFRQYVLAEFTDDGSVFGNVMSCVHGEKLEFSSRFEVWTNEQLVDKPSVMSIDWGKTGDYTVATVWCYHGNDMYLSGFIRFRKTAYLEAINIHIYKFYKQWKNISIVIHDATGVGGGLVESMEARYTQSTVIANVWSNSKKTEMVNIAILSFERTELHLPYWSTLLAETTSYEMKVNAIGTVTYSAPEGEHDDCVCSMIQGIWALENEFGDYSKGFTLDALSGNIDYYDDQMKLDNPDLTIEDKRNFNIECQSLGIPLPYPDIPYPCR